MYKRQVIVKDMSRLGRNYLQVGMYTEMIFPQKGVRFIAINDGVDGAQGDKVFAPLRNIFNEWLVRDTSKKIRAVKRSKGMSGKPIIIFFAYERNTFISMTNISALYARRKK